VLTIVMTVGSQFTFINGFFILLPSLLTDLNITRISLAIAVIKISANMLYTLIAMLAVDRFGRRALLMAGGAVMALSSALTFILTQSNVVRLGEGDAAPAIATVLLVMLYISAFAWSWAPLPWSIPAELAEWKVRGAITTVAAVSIAIAAIAAYSLFPIIACAVESYLHLVACVVVLLLTLLMYLLLPETARVPLHDTSLLFMAHPLWSRLIPLEEWVSISRDVSDAHSAVPKRCLSSNPDAPIYSSMPSLTTNSI
jgi:MFS family permease